MRLNLLVLLLILSNALSATEREEKIKTLMQAQGILTTFQQQMDLGREQSKEYGQTMLSEMLTDFEPPARHQDEITQAFNSYVDTLSDAWGADELVAVWAKYYGASFTEDELDALIQHYSSPLAQKETIASREALQNFSAHFAESSVQLQTETLQDFQSDLKDILTKCNCKKKKHTASADENESENTLESNLESLLAQAREQRDFGDYAESMESYLKFFEESRNTSYAGVRLSYVPTEMKKMGESYIPALDALHDLRDAREKRIFASRASWGDINEWSSLSEIIDGNEYIITAYDQFRFRGNNDPIVLSNVLEHNWEAFIEAGRYSELVSLAFQKWGNLDSMVSTIERSDRADVRDSMGDYVVREYARIYEVLLATENSEDARQLSESLLSNSKTGVTYHALITAAKAAGKDAIASSFLSEAQVNLSEEDYKIAKEGKAKPENCSGNEKE